MRGRASRTVVANNAQAVASLLLSIVAAVAAGDAERSRLGGGSHPAVSEEAVGSRKLLQAGADAGGGYALYGQGEPSYYYAVGHSPTLSAGVYGYAAEARYRTPARYHSGPQSGAYPGYSFAPQLGSYGSSGPQPGAPYGSYGYAGYATAEIPPAYASSRPGTKPGAYSSPAGMYDGRGPGTYVGTYSGGTRRPPGIPGYDPAPPSPALPAPVSGTLSAPFAPQLEARLVLCLARAAPQTAQDASPRYELFQDRVLTPGTFEAIANLTTQLTFPEASISISDPLVAPEQALPDCSEGCCCEEALPAVAVFVTVKDLPLDGPGRGGAAPPGFGRGDQNPKVVEAAERWQRALLDNTFGDLLAINSSLELCVALSANAAGVDIVLVSPGASDGAGAVGGGVVVTAP